jgi:hypothetical protein
MGRPRQGYGGEDNRMVPEFLLSAPVGCTTIQAGNQTVIAADPLPETSRQS